MSSREHDRVFAFFGQNRAAVGMEEQSIDESTTRLTFAFAFCNYRDHFEKRIARKIIDGRLDAAQQRDEPVRLTYTTLYRGERPRKDVFNRILDELRAIPKDREWEFIHNAQLNITTLLEDVAMSGLHRDAVISQGELVL